MRTLSRQLFLTSFAIFLLTVSVQPVVAALSIDDFMEEASLRDAELSPDGKHLAMVIHEKERRMVVVRNVETPDMPIIGAFAEESIKPSWVTWGNNDRLLISMTVPWNMFVKKLQRSAYFEGSDNLEFSRMVSVNKDMSDMAVLMAEEEQLKRNFSLSRITNYLPKDSSHVLMAAYRLGKRVLYKVDINSGQADFVTRGSDRTFRFLNDDDGKPLYRFDYRKRSKTIEIFKFKSDEDWGLVDKIRLSNDDEDSINGRGLVALDRDNLVYRKRNDETGYYELVRVGRATPEKQVLASPQGQDVLSAIFNKRSDQIIGYQVEKDNVRNVYFDEATQQQYDAIAERVGNYNFEVSSLAPEAQRALVGVHGPDTPYTYYLWDFAKRELTFLAHANPNLTPEKLSTPALTNYTARDGTSLRAYILLPRSYRRGNTFPTIILPHGGPQSRSRQDYHRFAQFLSTRGYIVVMPNFRGSVGYGRDFEVAGYRQWGGLMQDDLTDAAQFMVAKGFTDPQRICIVGASYGGYAALMGAIKTPDLYQCAISLNGVTHLAKMVEYDMKELVDKSEWNELLFDRVGNPKDDEEMLDANSPALNADKISIPVMIVAGTADEIVPYSQAKKMVKALKKAKADYAFISLEDTGHNPFYYREDEIRVFKAIEAFLKNHLN